MMKNEKFTLIGIWVILAVVTIGLSFIIKPSITGFVVYEEHSYVENWGFDDPDDYVYNDSLIEVTDGEAKLIPTISYTFWNTSNEIDYSIITALHNPKDKTDKVNALDNQKQEVNENKILDIFFNESIGNGDVISLYIDEGDEGIIYLCDKGTLCDAPGYGSVDYDEEEGWYNITVNGLDSPTEIFSIHPSDNVEINYITSTRGEIASVLYNPSDKTDKVIALDNQKVEINKAKLLNLIFDDQLDNRDIISLYIKEGDDSDIYLCDYGMECDAPGYGSVDYDEGEGWYNITVSGLDSATNAFNLDPIKIKIDYIKAVHIEYEEHNSTNTTYPDYAEIETDDLEVEDLLGFDQFSKEESLNGQTIGYSYSVDSGLNWDEIPEDNDLSGVNASNGKIRIKAVLNSNRTDTPVLENMAVSYSTRIIVCSEEWTAVYGGCLIDDTRLKTYTDSNNCGTSDGVPVDNGTYVSCDYCTPDWYAVNNSCDLNDSLTQWYDDQNNCYATTGLESDNNPPVNETLSCDYCTPDWHGVNTTCRLNNTMVTWYNDSNGCFGVTGLESDNVPPANMSLDCDYCVSNWYEINTSCQPDNTITGWYNDSNSCYAVTGLESDNNQPANNTYSCDYIVSTEFRGSSTDLSAVNLSNVSNAVLEVPSYGKINFSETISINQSIDLDANIEITNNSIFINSTALPGFNKSAVLVLYNLTFVNPVIMKDGVECPPSICKKIRYENGTIAFNVSHFTTYSVSEGLYCGDSMCNNGETCSTCSADCGTCPIPESEDEGGGSGGGTSTAVDVTSEEEVNEGVTETRPEEAETYEDTTETQPEETVCYYGIDVFLDDEISFVEEDNFPGEIINKGNCSIEKLHLYLSPGLEEIAGIADPYIENIGKGGKVSFSLIKKIEDKKRDVLTGAVTRTSKYNKMIAGNLVLEGIKGEEPILKREISLNVEISVEKKMIDKRIMAFIGFIVLSAISLFVFLKKNYKKKTF